MKIFDRFILKSYMGPMFLTFFIVLFVLMLQFIWVYIDDLVGKGLTLDIIFEFIFWGTSMFISLALPLSTMLASIMTTGNFGEHNELLAMKAAGLSVQRVMLPLFFWVLLISIGAFFISNNMIPYSNMKIYTLQYDINKKRKEVKIPTGVFYDGLDNISLYAETQEDETGLMRNIIVYDHRGERGNTNVTLAKSGHIRLTDNKQHLIFTLYDGYTYEDVATDRPNDTSAPFQRRAFDEQIILVSLVGYDFKRSDDGLYKNDARTQSLGPLTANIDSLQALQTEYRGSQSENFQETTSLALRSQPDSLNTAQRPYAINCDSVFNTMTLERQSSAAATAISTIERVMNSIEPYFLEDNIRDIPIRRARVEWHRKFTLSFACLIFFFIGAPLGAIIRKGGFGMPVVVSLFFFVVYWVIDISGIKLSRDGVVDPAFGVWLSTLVLLPIGIFLTYKATTDSALFNVDKYRKFFDKFKKKKNRE